MDKKNLDNLQTLLKGGEVDKNISVGYTPDKSKSVTGGVKRNPGDEWEHNGKTWVMDERGNITNKTRFDGVRVPMFCPKCERVMKGKKDTTSFYSHGTCLDCMVDYHNELRKRGVLERFSWQKRLLSAQSYLKDQQQQFEEFKVNVEKNPEFILSDGTRERWNMDVDNEKIIQEYQSHLDTYEKDLIDSISKYEQQYNARLADKQYIK